MAKRRNVFTADLSAFLESLNDISHCKQVIEWRLRASNRSVKESLAALKDQGQDSGLGAWGRLAIANVFDPRGRGYEPYGMRGTEGEGVIPMTMEMQDRFHSYLLVGMYERTEAYFKSMYALLLYQLRGEVQLRSKKGFHKSHPKSARRVGDAGYYLEYAKYACRRDCDEALRVFQGALPWDSMEFHRMKGMHFEDVVEVLAFCRHCIVHGEGRLPDTGVVGLSAHQADFVQRCMRKSLLTEESTILPNSQLVSLAIEALASYGYALYVLLTEKCGMRLDKDLFHRS